MKQCFSTMLVVFILCASGCATFVKDTIPPSQHVPEHIDSAQKVDMTYCVAVRNPSHISAWRINENNVGKCIRDYFMSTGYFHTVKQSKKQADFHVAFEFIMNANPNERIFKNLTALCLSLLPVWYSHDAELSATVYAGGEKRARFFARAGVTRVWWAPIALVGIFKNDRTAEAAIEKNYFNNLLLQMDAADLLPVKQHALSPAADTAAQARPAAAVNRMP